MKRRASSRSGVNCQLLNSIEKQISKRKYETKCNSSGDEGKELYYRNSSFPRDNMTHKKVIPKEISTADRYHEDTNPLQNNQIQNVIQEKKAERRKQLEIRKKIIKNQETRNLRIMPADRYLLQNEYE